MTRYVDAEAVELICRENTNMSAAYLASLLNRVPTVDVAPVRHAHWIEDEKHGLEKCSICNEIRHFDIYDDPNKVIYLSCNYCPNCGAKMDEKEVK